MIKQKFKLKTLGLVCASALALSAFTASAQAQDASENTVDEQYIWDLTEFYATKEDWEKELERLRGEVEKRIAKYPGVYKSERGAGLMLGIVAGPPNGEIVAKAVEHGLLTVPAGDNVVRLIPPLTIGMAEVDEAIAILDKTASELASAH